MGESSRFLDINAILDNAHPGVPGSNTCKGGKVFHIAYGGLFYFFGGIVYFSVRSDLFFIAVLELCVGFLLELPFGTEREANRRIEHEQKNRGHDAINRLSSLQSYDHVSGRGVHIVGRWI